MENVLGMKVHTGDNIVVAPSQTLNNYEYHMLRELQCGQRVMWNNRRM